MAFILMDAEDYIGDFGTATGIMAMYERGLPALREFIDAGTADAALIPKIIAETKEVKDLKYIAEMLSHAVPPVIISDGIADVPPGEDQFPDDVVVVSGRLAKGIRGAVLDWLTRLGAKPQKPQIF